ncbi:O-acyltransferase WSD1 [Neltuma alba]|uniref:O-acyltransferase WSD1 n=1 Tax=Neltuma alba TaxID=207710 RepID=UPI0010A493DC|nr:O-acyltransferase WSD1-like [Prosopis alba]
MSLGCNQVRDEKGVKRWKQVEVSLEDHIIIPELFSPDMSIESCTECFNEYVSRIAMEQPPRFKPLWQLHIIKNPINTIIVQFHHSLGDGYTLMSILFSCLKRADDPSLPLTFPSLKSSKVKLANQSCLRRLPSFISAIYYSIADFGWNLLKSTWVKDDISPIRSKNEGVEFRPATILNITFSLEQTKEIKSKLGVTVNDVITGVIFYGIRLYMQDIEYESKTNNCTLLTMMSTRDVERYTTAKDMQESKGKGRLGNQIIYLHTSIPKLNDILISNPLQSVWEAHREIKRKRRSFAIVLIEKLLRIQHRFRGPEAMAKHLHRAIRNTSLMVSNIVGPVHQVAFENYPIKSFYFTGSGLPQSVLITIMSYNGKLTVTTRAEADFIDHPKLASYLNSAYEMIRKAALGIPSQEEKGIKKHL